MLIMKYRFHIYTGSLHGPHCIHKYLHPALEKIVLIIKREMKLLIHSQTATVAEW